MFGLLHKPFAKLQNQKVEKFSEVVLLLLCRGWFGAGVQLLTCSTVESSASSLTFPLLSYVLNLDSSSNGTFFIPVVHSELLACLIPPQALSRRCTSSRDATRKTSSGSASSDCSLYLANSSICEVAAPALGKQSLTY